MDIFYGTDRAVENSASVQERYGGRRGSLQYGIVQVSVPHSHKSGQLESPFWGSWNPDEHVMLLNVQQLHDRELETKVKAQSAANNVREVLVYIHGYNTSFTDAARRTAQLVHDLRWQGVPAMFSWPSNASLLAYNADKEDAEWTVPNLQRFLQKIASYSGAAKMHIIAHSMGNRSLTAALRNLAVSKDSCVFNQLILAAPDVDADVFYRDLLPAIRPKAQRITLYISGDDRALGFSHWIAGYPRAGVAGDARAAGSGIDIIDAGALESGLIKHAYTFEHTAALADLFNVLCNKLGPEKRRLRALTKGELRYWQIPP